MKYVDKRGREISQERWRELFLLPHYWQVKETKGVAHAITTTWLGLQPDEPTSAGPFLIEHRKLVWGEGDKPEWLDLEDFWARSLQQALAIHRRLVRELKFAHGFVFP